GSRRIDRIGVEAYPPAGWALAGARPVAEPGQQFTIETSSGSNGRLTGDIYHPDTVARIKIICAVFDDGDFAGDRKQAFSMLQGATCHRRLMKRLVELLNERIESGATDLV